MLPEILSSRVADGRTTDLPVRVATAESEGPDGSAHAPGSQWRLRSSRSTDSGVVRVGRLGCVSRSGRRSRAAAFTTEAYQRKLSGGNPIRSWRSCSCLGIHDLDPHVLEVADLMRGHPHAASRRDLAVR